MPPYKPINFSTFQPFNTIYDPQLQNLYPWRGRRVHGT